MKATQVTDCGHNGGVISNCELIVSRDDDDDDR